MSPLNITFCSLLDKFFGFKISSPINEKCKLDIYPDFFILTNNGFSIKQCNNYVTIMKYACNLFKIIL